MYKVLQQKLWAPPRVIVKILLIMRLTTIILIAAIMQVSASSVAQKITLREKNAPLVKIFERISEQSGYDFMFSTTTLKGAKNVTINVSNAELKDVLQTIFKDQPLEYEIDAKAVVVSKKETSFLDNIIARFQAMDVRGRVVDEKGIGLPGATVKVKSTGKGVLTDRKGDFYLKGVDENELLLISFIGYATKEVNVKAEIGDVQLQLSDSKLDEVQVIAYGQTSKRLSTGNISTVKAEDIVKAPVGNPLLAIAGRVPGIFIEQESGLPGSGVKIRIQGNNSLEYGNEPFYVIDGVPYTAQLLPSISGELGLSGGSPLSFINPQDIESIDILKDADATSIYGSRAANGAIIIKTKKGATGRMNVNFNVQNGWGRITRRLDLLNTEQYLAMRREAFANDNVNIGTAPTPARYDLTFWDQSRYTDWQKELIGGTAGYFNAMTSISGGSELSQYLISAGFQREGTVTPGDARDEKASLHFNINSSSVNRKFKLSLSGSYLHDDNQMGGVSTIATAAFLLPPNAPKLYNEDGTLNWALLPDGTNSFVNPLYALMGKNVNKTTNLISNLQLNYEIISGLNLATSLGYNNLESDEKEGLPASAGPPHTRPFAIRSSSFNTAKSESWIIEPQLTYMKAFRKHRIDVLLGSTLQHENRDRQRLNATGFATDEAMYNIKAAGTVKVDNASNAVILSKYKYNAVFARFNYNFDEKYLINLTGRRDGSSRFGKENRFNDFGSIAGAWIFSGEDFLKENKFLSFGKIRFSYGITGSDQIGDYTYLNLYGNVSGVSNPYQGIIGLEPFSDFPNPYLQWEKTNKISSTLDLGFFKDRILLAATYYRSKSSNMLQFFALPTITGGTGLKSNLPAGIQNNGLELALNTKNIDKESLIWTTGFNLTIPRNKQLSYRGIDSEVKDEMNLRPVGTFKVYEMIGVDEETGKYIVRDRNGNATSEPDQNLDKTVFIDLNPKLYGGLQNSVRYKSFSLDFLAQFVKQKAQTGFFGEETPGFVMLNQPVSVLERWMKPGDQASIQRFGRNPELRNTHAVARQSDQFYRDASYIRLKNLSVSFQLSKTLTDKLNIQSARLFLQGQNLLTITNYKGVDPENRTFRGLPPLKVYTLGIQVGL